MKQFSTEVCCHLNIQISQKLLFMKVLGFSAFERYSFITLLRLYEFGLSLNVLIITISVVRYLLIHAKLSLRKKFELINYKQLKFNSVHFSLIVRSIGRNDVGQEKCIIQYFVNERRRLQLQNHKKYLKCSKKFT